jgi:hypothetical protein
MEVSAGDLGGGGDSRGRRLAAVMPAAVAQCTVRCRCFPLSPSDSSRCRWRNWRSLLPRDGVRGSLSPAEGERAGVTGRPRAVSKYGHPPIGGPFPIGRLRRRAQPCFREPGMNSQSVRPYRLISRMKIPLAAVAVIVSAGLRPGPGQVPLPQQPGSPVQVIRSAPRGAKAVDRPLQTGAPTRRSTPLNPSARIQDPCQTPRSTDQRALSLRPAIRIHRPPLLLTAVVGA